MSAEEDAELVLAAIRWDDAGEPVEFAMVTVEQEANLRRERAEWRPVHGRNLPL